MSLFAKKPIDQLMRQASAQGMKRTLTGWGLVALGIGAIIGAGLFVRTAAAAAQKQGPHGFIRALTHCLKEDFHCSLLKVWKNSLRGALTDWTVLAQ